MFNLKTRIDVNGFWYLIDSKTNTVFTFNYFVIGSQGRFSSGEITGHTSKKGWQFQDIEFQVLHIGVTKFSILEITELGEKKLQEKRSTAPDLSRRKMIMTTATTLLFGSTVLTPMACNSALLHSKEKETHNPYQEQFSPYDDDYSPY